MERKHRVWKPRLRARCKNSSKIHSLRSEPPDQSFLIASSLRIAESERIQGSSSQGSVPSLLLQLLGIGYFCYLWELDILTFLCHCIILVPLGDRCDRRGWIRFLVPPSQQWHLDRINHFLRINIPPSCSMTDNKSRIMSQRYRFDVSVRMGPLSSQDDVCESFKEILLAADARIKISGLENCSFSYDVPDEGLVKISGYLHVDKASRLYETTVLTWILDERIIGEIEWTPVLPGRHGDWR